VTIHGIETCSRYFRATGRLLAKAILDGQIVAVGLNRPLLKHVLGQPVSFDDLEQTDAALHHNLRPVQPPPPQPQLSQ